MYHVTSNDGTVIAFERIGQGPALVIVGGVLGDHMQQAGLAQLLASDFTVYNIDRRGHGESGFTAPYAVEREVEDLDALIMEAGGSAFIYGTSGLAILCLEAAARGLSPKMKKLAVWEPPYILEGSRPPVPQDYQKQLDQLLAEGRRGDMIELWMTQAVGMPSEFVAQLRQAPFWPAQEAFAHTLVYDAILTGDFSLPTERLARITVETLAPASLRKHSRVVLYQRAERPPPGTWRRPRGDRELSHTIGYAGQGLLLSVLWNVSKMPCVSGPVRG